MDDDWLIEGGATDPGFSEQHHPQDSLWNYSDGTVWDLGPADVDADGDGVADSIISEVDGQFAILTDTDGDGRVDRLTTLEPDGSTQHSPADGEPLKWSPTSLGRLR